MGQGGGRGAGEMLSVDLGRAEKTKIFNIQTHTGIL